eukprot:GEMP01136351.1.p1 GENE.GEMP01136351.1~~GEMP01136351.1.p1  ORF type:complete len:102 (-),score=6.68 GEMP01136351.1:77-382(-)
MLHCAIWGGTPSPTSSLGGEQISINLFCATKDAKAQRRRIYTCTYSSEQIGTACHKGAATVKYILLFSQKQKQKNAWGNKQQNPSSASSSPSPPPNEDVDR